MSPSQVRKQVICPECGRPLQSVSVTTAAVEADLLPDEDELSEAMAVPDSGSVVETVVEEGPVCPRCAGR